MSLIECCECGKEISSHATRCVHCGFPAGGNVARPGWKRTKILLGLLSLSAIAGAVIEKDPLLRYLHDARARFKEVPASQAVSSKYKHGAETDITAESHQNSEAPVETLSSESIDPNRVFAVSPENASDGESLATDTAANRLFSASPAAVLPAKGAETGSAGRSIAVDPAALIRRIIDRDREVYRSFHALDYTHYWTVDDLDKVAGCIADRKELLYGLSALHLIEHDPEYDLVIEFLRLENTAATAVMDYYRDMIATRFTRPANPFFVTRLQKAFSDIRKIEGKLEKYGWTKAYAAWGQGKK